MALDTEKKGEILSGDEERLVKEGLENIQELSGKISVLSEIIQKASANMEQLEKLAGMVEGFAGVIAGISKKTNMLALNASIEAARAGEHGRGFAVVAKQVGELAAQSAQSSKEIKDTIQSIQTFSIEMDERLNILASVVVEQEEITTNTNAIFQRVVEIGNKGNDI